MREPHCSMGGAGRADPSSQARDRDPPTLPSPVLRTALPGVASPANPAASPMPMSFTVIGGRYGGSKQSEEAHDGQGVHPHDDVAGWVHRGSE
jgi:hypothetical protein